MLYGYRPKISFSYGFDFEIHYFVIFCTGNTSKLCLCIAIIIADGELKFSICIADACANHAGAVAVRTGQHLRDEQSFRVHCVAGAPRVLAIALFSGAASPKRKTCCCGRQSISYFSTKSTFLHFPSEYIKS
jgi:hypothetical protein